MPAVDFAFGFTGDALAWWPDDGGGGNQNIIGNVANNDGPFHTIGWEADLGGQTLTFFDGVRVGNLQDAYGGGAFGDDLLIFGTVLSGGYDNTWDRIVFKEGSLL